LRSLVPGHDKLVLLYGCRLIGYLLKVRPFGAVRDVCLQACWFRPGSRLVIVIIQPDGRDMKSTGNRTHRAAGYCAIDKVISLKWNEGTEAVPPEKMASSRPQ